MKKLLAILLLIPLLMMTAEANAVKSSISVQGILPSNMPNQYLVLLKICAGDVKLDAPKLYVSSDSAESGSLELRAVLAPNSCRYQDITIRANDPDSIKVSFNSLDKSDERIDKLEKELADLKKQLVGKTTEQKKIDDAKTAIKKSEPKKMKEQISKQKNDKQDPVKSILLTESDIEDEKTWKVETAYDGAYYMNLPDGTVADSGIKRVIVQHYVRNDKLISAKEPWTIGSMIQIYKSDKSPFLTSSLDNLKKNSDLKTMTKKIGNANCLASMKMSDRSSYVCNVGKVLIFVDGLQINNKSDNKDLAGQIMESIVKKIQASKIT